MRIHLSEALIDRFADALAAEVSSELAQGQPLDILDLIEGDLLAVRERVAGQLVPRMRLLDPHYDEDPNPSVGISLRAVHRQPTEGVAEIGPEHVALVLPYWPDELARVRQLRVGFVGLGSSQICSSILARSGVEHFVLMDGDRFEASNVRQQFCSSETLGQFKVHATARALRAINSAIEVIAVPKRASRENIGEYLDNVDVVFSGVDNYESRILVDAYCKRAAKPMLSVAFAGWEGRYFASMPTDPEWAQAVKGSRPTPHYGTHPVGIAMLWSFAASDALKIALGDESIVRYPLMLCVNLRRASPAVIRDARLVHRLAAEPTAVAV